MRRAIPAAAQSFLNWSEGFWFLASFHPQLYASILKNEILKVLQSDALDLTKLSRTPSEASSSKPPWWWSHPREEIIVLFQNLPLILRQHCQVYAPGLCHYSRLWSLALSMAFVPSAPSKAWNPSALCHVSSSQVWPQHDVTSPAMRKVFQVNTLSNSQIKKQTKGNPRRQCWSKCPA